MRARRARFLLCALALPLTACAVPRRQARRALRALDVHPRVAMQILRHSRVAITMEIYTEVPSTATREALRRLGQWLEDTQT